MTDASVVVIWIWIIWLVSWVIAAFWSDRAAKRPPTRRQLLYRVLAIVGYCLLFGAYPHRFRQEIVLWRGPRVFDWIMVAMTVGGFVFAWWARLHIGRLWSSSVTRKAAHRLIDTGPYGLVRHPIYTGITLASIATACIRGTAAGWAGALVMTMGWYVKARLEEEFLRGELGEDQYGAYARRVPMLVPFV